LKALKSVVALVTVGLLAVAIGAVAADARVGPAARSLPADFGPASFTAISDSEWWLLGDGACKSPPCTAIVTTRNAGRTFSLLPAPKSAQIHELRFADAENGFAFGPELWSTHDGGGAWKQVGVGGSVVDLAASEGQAYALVRTTNGLGRLLRSPVGRDDWHAIGTFSGYPFSGLWAQGATVLIETQNRSASRNLVFISKDFGDHFKLAGHAPPSIACHLQAMLPVIWAPCATGTESGVWRSRDAGAHFLGVGGDATRSGVPPEPNSAAFAAASPTVAVYGYQQLWRTSDAGGRWSRIPGTRGAYLWTYLGFTDSTHGVAVGEFPGGYRLYYTTDGGRTYRRVPIRG
jgi:hypothetical protein